MARRAKTSFKAGAGLASRLLHALRQSERNGWIGAAHRDSGGAALRGISDRPARSVKSTKQGRQGGELVKTLSLIRTHPGIRPSELNQIVYDGLRRGDISQ
jgi:hypothetical protein